MRTDTCTDGSCGIPNNNAGSSNSVNFIEDGTYYFFQDNCSACIEVDQSGVLNNYPSLIKYNAAGNQELIEMFNLIRTPTLIKIQNGDEVLRLESSSQIISRLQSNELDINSPVTQRSGVPLAIIGGLLLFIFTKK